MANMPTEKEVSNRPRILNYCVLCVYCQPAHQFKIDPPIQEKMGVGQRSPYWISAYRPSFRWKLHQYLFDPDGALNCDLVDELEKFETIQFKDWMGNNKFKDNGKFGAIDRRWQISFSMKGMSIYFRATGTAGSILLSLTPPDLLGNFVQQLKKWMTIESHDPIFPFDLRFDELVHVKLLIGGSKMQPLHQDSELLDKFISNPSSPATSKAQEFQEHSLSSIISCSNKSVHLAVAKHLYNDEHTYDMVKKNFNASQQGTSKDEGDVDVFGGLALVWHGRVCHGGWASKSKKDIQVGQAVYKKVGWHSPYPPSTTSKLLGIKGLSNISRLFIETSPKSEGPRGQYLSTKPNVYLYPKLE
jgi:hypothetical protein